MTRLLAFLLLLLSVAARAEEITFDTNYCGITLPDNETWQRGNAQKIEGGDTIFNATQIETKEAFAICVLPNIPANDLRNEGVTAVVLRTLGVWGFQSGPPKWVDMKGIPCLQFVAKKSEPEPLLCVARASMREKTLYLELMMARGDQSLMENPRFFRVMDTFRFVDPESEVAPLASNPLFSLYRKGAYACVALVTALGLMFAGVLFFTRRAYR